MPTSSEKLQPDQHQTQTSREETRGLYSALILSGETFLARKVLECGTAAWRYHCHACGADLDLPIRCRVRLCPLCNIDRARHFIADHLDQIEQIREPKLLTLTFKSPPFISKEVIARYQTAFTKLRRAELWTKAVQGGASALEFTFTPQGWHPHFHALLDAHYISQSRLSALWKTITGDSFVVYIQAADRYNAITEVAKYITKGAQFYEQRHLVMQYLATTKGKRFFTTFGSLYRRTTPEPQPNKKKIPQSTGDLVNPPGPNVPLVTVCWHCQATTLTYQGYVLTVKVEPPPIQIPF